ncbi:MAG: carbon monoxide dehydrogenase [Terriglobia bacterium]|nr:MAG: carbon monoxide dehydrogenase [Terriglobia bacterium]
MKISGAHVISVPQERAYALLQDPAVLGRSMPGCDALEKIGENEYHMKMKMVLASMNGLFDGKVRITDANPFSSFRLIVEGAGKIGFMRGNGLLTLAPLENGTNVQYEGSVEVGGTIAAVGQRLLDTTSRMLIKRFFDKLSTEIAASGDKAGSALPA